MRIVEWRPGQARLLAVLWNASDSGWISGTVRRRPMTPSEAREWEGRFDAVGRFLALEDGRPVGFARLTRWFSSPDATYVMWLNVDPAYHGRGIGKALLLETIARTRALGMPRVDLHTWPGNDKARPLYKRLGWKWVPGSHAYLQNYVPRILEYGPARGFFARHPWTDALQADVARDHDEDALHGVDVFRYRFLAGGERMEVVVNRAAREVMAFEDRDLRAESWIPRGVLVEGVPGEVRYLVRNKTSRMAQVEIRPHARPGTRVSPPMRLRMPPRSAKEVAAPVRIPAGFKDSPEDWAAPAIASTVLLAGREIPLHAGFRPKPVLGISWELPGPKLAAPGRREASVVLRNHLPRPIRGTLRVSAHGLEVSPARVALRLGTEGRRVLRLRLSTSRAEARAASVRVAFRGSGLVASKALPLPCLPAGGRVAYRDGDDLVLETPSLRVVSRPRGGQTALVLPDGASVVRSVFLCAGPPYWASDAESAIWRGRLEAGPDPAIVRVLDSKARPGLRLEQRWRLPGERSAELRTTVENRGPRPWTVRTFGEVGRGIEYAVATFPTPSGPVAEAFMDFEWPDQRRDAPLDRVLSEGWVHFGTEQAGVGVVWPSAPASVPNDVEMEIWGAPVWYSRPVRLAPGHRRDLGPILFESDPDWRRARERWSHLAGRPLANTPRTMGVQHLVPTPSVVLASPAADVRLDLANVRRRPLRGDLRVIPDGVACSPRRFDLPDVSFDRPWSSRLRVEGRRPGVRSIRLVLRDPRGDFEWRVPVLASDGRGPVRVRGASTGRVLENGFLRATVAPAHAASLTSLRAAGHERLVSSHPTPGSFSWFRPFHGGLHPYVYTEDWPGNLYRERVAVGLARRGTWTGVRLRAGARRSDLPKGTRVQVEYLTRPGSPFLAGLVTVRNRGRERRMYHAGLMAFLGHDGRPTCEASFRRIVPRVWRTGEWPAWALADDGFAAFRAPGAAHAIGLLAGEGADLEVVDLRTSGRHGIVHRKLELEPGQAGSVLLLLAVMPRDEAPALASLRGLSEASFAATRTR